jgi:hypothetical protein
MKTLIGTGIGALVLGGLVTAQVMKGSSAQAFNAAAAGPVLVNCGAGQRALVRPAVDGAQPVSQVECLPETGLLQAGPIVPAFQPLSPVVAPPVTRERVVYRDRPVYASRTIDRVEAQPTQTTRSWKKSALIIGGTAAAGAGLGAIVDGGSGAKKGAVIGGVAGTVYDLATRTKTRYE